uniref:Uncharacterized protein n=1 Tax=Anopheles maculatus TaxID=74869 RepID=A0A182SQP6_9DIPT
MNSNAVALLLFVALAVCIGDSAEIPPLPVQDDQTTGGDGGGGGGDGGASSSEAQECKFVQCVIINFFLHRSGDEPVDLAFSSGFLGLVRFYWMYCDEELLVLAVSALRRWEVTGRDSIAVGQGVRCNKGCAFRTWWVNQCAEL